MTQQLKAMKLALEVLEINLIFLRNVKPFKGQEDLASDCIAMTEEAITALRQAIEQAEKQEPVAKVVSTAPKQIWLDLGFDPSDEDEISFNDLCDATWSHDNATGYGIEYVRSDLASPPQCQHEQEPVQIAGFDVVIDESMPPNKFKFEQAQKQEPVAWIIHDRVAPDRLSFVEVKESLQTEVTPLYKKE